MIISLNTVCLLYCAILFVHTFQFPFKHWTGSLVTWRKSSALFQQIKLPGGNTHMISIVWWWPVGSVKWLHCSLLELGLCAKMGLFTKEVKNNVNISIDFNKSLFLFYHIYCLKICSFLLNVWQRYVAYRQPQLVEVIQSYISLLLLLYCYSFIKMIWE